MADLLPERIDAGPVSLRSASGDHAAAVVEAIAASLPELAPWFAWAQATPDLQTQRSRLDGAARAFTAGTDFEFSIFEVSSDALVGGLRVNPHEGPTTAAIGYWIRSDRHRRGYASGATRAATSAVFDHLPHADVIEIHMDQRNVASVGVPRSVGYRLDREVDREILTPGHSGRGFVWVMSRKR